MVRRTKRIQESCPWKRVARLVDTLHEWWDARPQRQGMDKVVHADLARRAKSRSSSLLLSDKEARCLWAHSGKEFKAGWHDIEKVREAVALDKLQTLHSCPWGDNGDPKASVRPPRWAETRKVTKPVTASPPLWNGKKFTDDPGELEKLYKEDRERLWTEPRPVDLREQEEMIDWYRREAVRGRTVDVPLPTRQEIKQVIRNTKDSAAGIDDVPYAFWRLIIDTTADAIQDIFRVVCEDPLAALGSAPVSVQALVFIGKKTLRCLPRDRGPSGCPRPSIGLFLRCGMVLFVRPSATISIWARRSPPASVKPTLTTNCCRTGWMVQWWGRRKGP